jgi:hypothetical protein
MKTIKTASGVKRIPPCGEDATLSRIREILSDHRKSLINRLILDLPTYTDYRFNTKPSKEQAPLIIDRLYTLKHSPVDLTKYDTLVQKIMENENTHLDAELFYKEIDAAIGWEL